MFIATLIAKDRLAGGDISAAADALAAAGIAPFGRSWIEDDKACDLLFSADPAAAAGALEGLIDGVDALVQGEASRRRRLLVADMDSTMIEVECIDELADYAGVKAEVAAVTERAMRGEIGFEAALAERVALLAGLDEGAIDRCREERVRLTPGARALVRTMKREGAFTLLVSGGFTRFADPVGAGIGFDRVVANRLEIEAGRLDGRVAAPVLGAEGKRLALLDAARGAGLAGGGSARRRRRRQRRSDAEGGGPGNRLSRQARRRRRRRRRHPPQRPHRPALRPGLGAQRMGARVNRDSYAFPGNSVSDTDLFADRNAAITTTYNSVSDTEFCNCPDLLSLLLISARHQLGAAHVGGDGGEGEGDRGFADGEAELDPVRRQRADGGADRARFGVAKLDRAPSAGRALVSRKAPLAEMSRKAAGAGVPATRMHIRRRRHRDAIAFRSRSFRPPPCSSPKKVRES